MVRKDGTSRKGRGVEGVIVVRYLSNDITVCSGFILANETIFFFFIII